MDKYIKQIKIASNVGLWTSLAVGLAVVVFVLVSDYRFYMDNRSFQYFMYVGLAAAVLDMAWVLFLVRRRIPQLRQLDSLGSKFKGYAALVRGIYYVTMGVVVVESAIIVLSNNNRLIMFLLLIMLLLFLNFPNIYKIKVDLGLDDAQMRTLFGSDYISDSDEKPEA